MKGVKKMAEVKKRTLNDALPTAYIGGGIFSHFTSPVWKDDFNAADLDLLFMTRYGERLAAPLIEHFDTENGVSEDNIKRIASMLYAVNRSSWEHLYKANIAEYNPIENTDAYETETTNNATTTNGTSEKTESGTNSTTDNLTRTFNETEVHELGETDTVTHNTTVKTDVSESGQVDSSGSNDSNSSGENDLFGFNSTSAVNADSNSTTAKATQTANSTASTTTETTEATTGTETDAKTGTNTDKHTGTVTDGRTVESTDSATDSIKTTGSETGEITRELHRHGNIGVTTNFQMIQGEIDLWKWKFIETVMLDICKYIALSIY